MVSNCLLMLDKLKKAIQLSILYIFIFLISPSYSQSRLDSLQKLTPEVSENNLPNHYMDLFIESYSNNIYDLAMQYAELASTSALTIGDSLNYVRAEYATGHILRINAEFNLAIEHYLKAIKTARNNDLLTNEIKTLNSLALAYYALSKFDKALFHHFESLELREQYGSPIDVSIATNNIGLVYYQLSDFRKAKLYFERTLNIEDENNIVSDFGTYVNLGLTNIGLNNYDEALDYFSKTIDDCSGNCEGLTLIEAFDGRGLCYRSLGDIDKAEADWFKALELAKTSSVTSKLPSIYNGLANVFIEKGVLDVAKSYLDSSQNFAIEIGTPRQIRDNFKDYSKIAYDNGNFKGAYEYQFLYDSVRDVLLNEVIAKNLLQIQVDFQERENLEIIELKNKEIDRTTSFLIFALIIALLTAFIVVLLFKNNISRKKVNEKLHLANGIIENQNKELTNLNTVLEERVKERTEELRESNSALVKSNHDLDNFIYKTSHDIRGPLATLQGVCNIALMDISDPISVDYFQKLSKTANKLNRILSKLLIVNQINNSTPTLEVINLTNLIDEIIEDNRMGYMSKSIKVEVDGKSNLKVKSDPDLMKIICSNLINNAFKFHDPANSIDSFIKIVYKQEDDKLDLSITDNGLGIDENLVGQIFDIFSKTSEVQDSAGIGLYLVNLAIERLGGKIFVTKDLNGHTFFKVNIPNNYLQA